MQYSTQGCYVIEQQKNVLLVDPQGPFNEVITEKYYNDIKDITEKMCGEPWGSLITLRGNNIFTHDVEEQLKKTTLYRQQKGMVAIAVVILNSNCADMQQMQLQRIYRECQIESYVFSDRESASTWLNGFIEKTSLLSNKQQKKYFMN